MDKKTKELLKKNQAMLEKCRWAIESTRTKYVLGEDCAKLEDLEADISTVIVADVEALNAGEGE